MTSAASELNQSPPRIDYFSSLPNELLDDIFKHAYRHDRPTAPFSKHLFPFFEQYLYRIVDLSAVSQCPLFLESLLSRPHKGRIVRCLFLPERHKQGELHTDFFKTPNDSITLPPSLESLAIPVRSYVEETEDVYVDLAQFINLESHPALIDLELYEWQIYEHGNVVESRPTWLPRLKKLRIEGLGAEDESVKFLTMKCPALEELELDTNWDESPSIYSNLHNHPESLQALSLDVQNGDASHSQFNTLARFSNLRRIKLGDGCYPRNIHSVLLLLPELVEIQLGEGQIDAAGFESLVTGSSCLAFLKTFTLDFDDGQFGRRILRPSSNGFDAGKEAARCPIDMDDWTLPEQDESSFDTLGYRRLIRIAGESGIEVKGSVFSAFKTTEAYRIEHNNRAIIDSVSRQHLVHLQQVRNFASRDGVSLPPLDFDLLDSQRLEIVEIDLPEQDWFVLSLKNKE